MKFLLLSLVAAISLPTAATAESVWLVLRSWGGKGIEKIEMKDMDQCELMGAKWSGTKLTKEEEGFGRVSFTYECLKGK